MDNTVQWCSTKGSSFEARSSSRQDCRANDSSLSQRRSWHYSRRIRVDICTKRKLSSHHALCLWEYGESVSRHSSWSSMKNIGYQFWGSRRLCSSNYKTRRTRGRLRGITIVASRSQNSMSRANKLKMLSWMMMGQNLIVGQPRLQ